MSKKVVDPVEEPEVDEDGEESDEYDDIEVRLTRTATRLSRSSGRVLMHAPYPFLVPQLSLNASLPCV